MLSVGPSRLVFCVVFKLYIFLKQFYGQLFAVPEASCQRLLFGRVSLSLATQLLDLN